MPADLFVLRHGRSEANERGIIASSLEIAGDDYGLTEDGAVEIRASLEHERRRFTDPVIVLSSPLLRARASAQIAAGLLRTSLEVDDRLIERAFGDLELGPDERYREVWALDRRDPTHRTWRVEAVADVLARARPLVEAVRAARHGSVVLVTHGDVASTLICASLGAPLSRHREVGALATGQLRGLDWPPPAERRIFGPESPIDPAD